MILLDDSDTHNVPSSGGLIPASEIALVPELSFCQNITLQYMVDSDDLVTPHDPTILNTLLQSINSERRLIFFRRRIILKLWYYNVCGLSLAQALAFYDADWSNALTAGMSISDFIGFCNGDQFPCIILYYVDSIRDEAVLLDEELEILGQSIHPYVDYCLDTSRAQSSSSYFIVEDYEDYEDEDNTHQGDLSFE